MTSSSRLAIALVTYAALACGAASAHAAPPLVSFEHAGSYPFQYDRVTVSKEGRMRVKGLDGSRVSQLPEKRMGKLRLLLREARWDTLGSAYRAEHEVGDASHWRLRHRGKTVTAETGAEIPRRLRRVIRWFSRRID